MLKAINRGRHGLHLKRADIGRDYRDELLNDLGVISNRAPEWLVLVKGSDERYKSATFHQIHEPGHLAPRYLVSGGHT